MALGYKFCPQSHLFFGDVISELFNLITNIVRYFFDLENRGQSLRYPHKIHSHIADSM